MSLLAALSSSQELLTVALLLATRLGALLLMTPPLGAAAVPATVRIAVVLALAALFAGNTSPNATFASLDSGTLLLYGLSELALGATMALGVSLGFAAFAIGGRLLDGQIGFGIGQVFDPLTRQQLPVLAGAFNQLALVMFFAADGHLALFKGFALSVERFPPGSAWPLDQAVVPLLHQVSALFGLGFAMVAPVVFCLFLVEVGLGVLSRSLPQMNTFLLGIPLKIIVGLAALSVWVAATSGVVARTHAAMFSSWEALFR